MTEDIQHNSGPRHAKKTNSVGKTVAIVLAIALLLGALGFAGYFAYTKNSLPFLPVQSNASSSSEEASVNPPESTNALDASGEESSLSSAALSSGDLYNDRAKTAAQEKADKERAEAEAAAAAAEAAAKAGIPTPLIAEYDGVKVHTPIKAQDLEGILFHQAATEFGLVLSTQLPEADPEKMLTDPDYEIAEEQPTGDAWLIAKALHLWRADTTTDMDTSIDVGAEAATQVYASVTGTVVLVKTYRLYDMIDDYEVHIQPDGRPDLDVVTIHIQDVSVKAGDKVVGGETPLAKVRDLAGEGITDIQLAFYSKAGHGNHTHVQVNNADAPTYRETRLKDAIKVE